MTFGLSSDHFDFILNTLKPLTRKGATIWCYGSRARGDYREFSDLDLMVEAKPNSEVRRELRKIKETLEESRLPIKVDLVIFEDFAKSYVEGYLKDRKPFEAPN